MTMDERLQNVPSEELEQLIDTGIELLGMIRDGDTDTDDPRALALYHQLFD